MRVRLAWAFLFALASFGLLQKYTGLVGCLAYALICVAALWCVQTTRAQALLTSVQRWLLPLVFLGCVGIFVAFKLKFPQWEARVDRNEALDLAVQQLLQGLYPYDVKTQLGNLLSPLPGAILLAFPFVLMGSSSYQNFFWLALILVWLKRHMQVPSAPLGFLFMLCASLSFLQEWLFGGDLIANNLYVLVAVLGLLRLSKDEAGASMGPLLLATALFFGIALSSRPNFVFWFLLVFGFLARRRGIRSILRPALATMAAGLAVTLPFWLYAPSRFAPLHAGSKINVSGVWNSYLIVGLMLGLTLLAVWRCRDEVSCLGWGALIQAIPVVFVVLLLSAKQGKIDFSFTKERYGLNFVIPGCVWCWYRWEQLLKDDSGRYESV